MIERRPTRKVWIGKMRNSGYDQSVRGARLSAQGLELLPVGEKRPGDA